MNKDYECGHHSYRGYDGLLFYSFKAKSFYGYLINIKDTICFEGQSIDECVRWMHIAVDDYIDDMKDVQDEQQKSSRIRDLVRRIRSNWASFWSIFSGASIWN